MIIFQGNQQNNKTNIIRTLKQPLIFLALGKKQREKIQGFNGIRTRDLRDTGAMLYQLSYEATHCSGGSRGRAPPYFG